LADRGSLPLGSVLTVQLQNLTRPFYEVAGGKTVLKAEGTGPFRFDLFIDPRYLTPSDQYQLTAFVSSNNQVIYNLRQPVLVPVQGLNQLYNLALDRPYTPPPASVATTPNSFPANSFPATSFPPSAEVSSLLRCPLHLPYRAKSAPMRSTKSSFRCLADSLRAVS
jgi:hypothetical protein